MRERAERERVRVEKETTRKRLNVSAKILSPADY